MKQKLYWMTIEMKLRYTALEIVLTAGEANADNSCRDALIGDTVNGSGFGGRDGVILGCDTGGATDDAIAAGEDTHRSGNHGSIRHNHHRVQYESHYFETQPKIPQGHMPPPRLCRIWHPLMPPSHHPPPRDCRLLIHWMPPGTRLVHLDAGSRLRKIPDYRLSWQ